MRRIHSLAHKIAHLVYPETQPCARCQTLVPGSRHGRGLCAGCLEEILDARIRARPCLFCGYFRLSEKEPCSGLCAGGLGSLNGALAAAPYHGMFRQWVQSLKYSAEKDLAKPMSLIMARVWSLHADVLTNCWKAPLKPAPWLTPVPLHPLKFAERGFNQSLLLAQALSEQLGYPVKELLIRKNQESNQADLSADRRKINVRNAFAPAPEWADRELPGNRLILVIDDIVTTGETLKACAAVLKGKGAAYTGGYAWAGGFEKRSRETG